MHPPRLDMVRIPPGTIAMRDARSRSSREVTLRAFEIGRTAVTSEQFGRSDDGAALGEAPRHPVTWLEAVEWCIRASHADGRAPAYAVSGSDVEWNVSADGYRLPTEAEWEWACRAGTTAPVYGPLSQIAWTAADSVDDAQPVGRKTANAFGLYDTIGNVWEWCWDYADPARYGDYRALRGGGWADEEWSCRASVRRGSAPDATLDDVGFRVARGSVGEPGGRGAQGWSAEADTRRADISGPLPLGWTPLGRPPRRGAGR